MMAEVINHPSATQAQSVVTEDVVADLAEREHGEDIRYCPEMGKWFTWSGTRWELDTAGHVFERTREVCRSIAIQTSKEKWGSYRTVQAVTNFLTTRAPLVTRAVEFDSDPWLLGTKTGFVDLKTGDFRKAERGTLITKATAVDPGKPHVEPKAWLKFLDQVTKGDKELQRFLQRMAGYALTGLVTQHALWFVYGPGGNGKGTFLNAIRAVMGTYAVHAPAETFMDTGARHPTELAMLQGARLVTASETEEGHAWAEAKIKALTGGDPITARFMRQDFFTFDPTFKLVIIGNHRPVLKNVDEAAMRRLKIVPFKIKPENPDLDLGEKLKREYPAILRWMIEGCLDWQSEEMPLPKIVHAETYEYFDDQDAIKQWLGECTDQDEKPLPDAVAMRCTSAKLFGSWVNWAKANGEAPGTNKRLSEELVKRGFRKKRTVAGAEFIGLRVKPSTSTDGQHSW